MTKKQKLIAILGPTASGKSDLAVTLAKKFNGEIISADSRQVYKGLDIGTGKITKKEMRGVKHYLLDVASPQKRFTASDYVLLVNEAIAQIIDKNKIPIICGGTGFYIDAILGEKQIPEVPPNPLLRKKLENKTVEELFEILKKLDPERAENIDAKNLRRLIRAIEICKALGKVPKFQKTDTKFKTLKIGIAPLNKITHPLFATLGPSLTLREGVEQKIPIIDKEGLKERINKRLEKRIKIGMIDEVKKLHKKDLSYKRMRELGLEYRSLADFLEKKINKKELVERLQKEIWQYAKRQMTYFKKDKSIKWFESLQIEEIEKEVREFMR